ncbi:MAG: nickel-responsive transcriptional regulator NikR [Verrucomicrobiota bacterium]
MTDPIERISISMPKRLIERLDDMNARRGFDSRSQAIASMVEQQLVEYDESLGEEVMTGTITIVYDQSKNNLKKRLAEIEYENIAEVISSLHVLLENEHTMEVILVQGPGKKLRHIADQLVSCKGVKNGTMSLHSALIPPLHSKSISKKK